MGVVYRARDLNLGRQVALKRPLSTFADNPQARLRFNREARAASRLQHPNIVTIFEVFEDGGFDWMAMEFVDGQSLSSYLSTLGPLPPRELLRHAEGLADALREAHTHRVIHRDIKPSNIIVDRQGLARLTDFGLARFQEPTEGDGDTTEGMPITEMGRVVGTAAYMSPEQSLGQEVDERTDIFSLGVVLYEMCTAQPAFADESRGRILDAILHHEPPAIPMFNSATTAEVIRIIGKCLAKRADERYQRADDLLADLRAERRRLHSSEYATSHPNQPESSTRSKTPLLAILGTATLVLAGFTSYLLLDRKDRPVPQATPRQVTALPGWEADVAISPDGGLLAYASNESGNSDIWVVDVRGGETLQLTHDPAPDRNPAWYPDGSSIAFHSERESGPGIWKVARLGGTPTMVLADARDPAISPDGRQMAVSTLSDVDQPTIALVDLEDPTRIRSLTDARHGLWEQRHPAWSPDGKWISYNDFRDLWLIPAQGGEPRRLTTDAASDKQSAWSASGEHIYFSSRREDTLALWRVRAQGGTPQRITGGTGPEVQPSLSSDGSLLTYTTFVQDLDPVVVGLDTGHSIRLRGARTDWGASLSPDNSGMVFVSNREGDHSLWWQALKDGTPSGNAVRLNDEAGESSNPAISPDGNWVAYQQRLGKNARIAILPLPAGLPRSFTDGSEFHIQPAWSPDGAEIAYLNEKDLVSELMIAKVNQGNPGGPARHVDTGDGSIMWPQWSPDGTEIAYIAARDDSWDVWIVSTSGNSPPRQLTQGSEALQVTWIPESGNLYASGFFGEQTISVRRIDPKTEESELLDWPFEFGAAAVYGIFDISNDESLASYTVEEEGGDLWIMEGSKGAF